MLPFAHLHVHTDYSLLDGACEINKLVRKVASLGHTHIAITDHGNMHGALEFYRAAQRASLRPIIGYEAYMAQNTLHDKELTPNGDYAYHLTLLAADEEGYKNLCRLASIASIEGFYYKPRIDFETLKKNSDGLICLSGCLGGQIPFHLVNGELAVARQLAEKYRELFGDRYYFELQNHGIDRQKTVNEGLLALSRELDIPVVATNDAHYINSDDSYAHEVLLCVGTKKRINDRDRMRFDGTEFYIKSTEQMLDAFPDNPEALENTQVVAERCRLSLTQTGFVIPGYSDGSGLSAHDLFRKLSYEGTEKRYGKERSKDVDERLEYELKCIADMGFETYFLIVQDFVAYAKNNGIPVGPGRGSAAGSLVAYALGITDLDPLRFDLIFERFLNPGRIQMPDIDIDFCQEKRHLVLDYVVNKYGAENVAQVVTFGTLGAKAVVRDVGRVLEMPQPLINRIAKLIPGAPGTTLEKAIQSSTELREMIAGNKEIENLFNVSSRLEGLSRNASVHAAAVVICDKPLYNYLPLSRAKKETGDEQAIVTQYSKDWVEEIGLLKMDFLGLAMLTTLEYAQRSIEESAGKKVVYDEALADPKTYELLCSGHTMGIFQLESRGMRELVRKLRPDCFEDISAVLALYRPGPLGGGMVDSFIKRKHGKEPIEYMHPILEPILRSTYGVILYQEQVIRIASVVGGFTLSEADKLRKAMGKKIPEIMDNYKRKFVENAPNQGVSAEIADKLFDYILNFAGYGFNKSHSAAYAVLTYRSAYLKAHYPLEFMAAVISSVLNDTDRLLDRLEECRQAGYEALPPDINRSKEVFCKEGKRGVRFGLAAIKGVGYRAATNIVEEAKKKPFSGIFEFCERVDLKIINKGTIEALINAGAMDCLPGNRRQKITVLEEAITSAQSQQADADIGQMNLFGGDSSPVSKDILPKMPDFTEEELLQRESTALGFFLTKHPVSRYEELASTFITCRIKDIHSAAGEGFSSGGIEDLVIDDVLGENEIEQDTAKLPSDGESVLLIVRIASLRRNSTRDGKQMAVMTIEDATGSMDAVAFPEVWTRLSNEMKDMPADGVFFVGGYLDLTREMPQIVMEECVRPSSVVERLTDTISIALPDDDKTRESIRWISSFVDRNTGPVRVSLRIPFDKYAANLTLPKEYKVKLTPQAMAELTDKLGKDSYKLIPRRQFNTSRRKNGFAFRNGDRS